MDIEYAQCIQCDGCLEELYYVAWTGLWYISLFLLFLSVINEPDFLF